MSYDPENKALEALETERDNLRVELAAARKVIAAGYGTCSTCKWWDPDPPSGTYDTGWGECRRHDGDHRLADGSPAKLGPGGFPGALERVAAAWATGYEVDESGFATTPDFGCVSHVKAPPR